MHKLIKTYLNSFTFPEKFWYSLILDIFFIAIIAGAFFFLSTYTQDNLMKITGNTNPDNLQNYLAQLSPLELQSFASEMQAFLIIFIVGFVVLLLATWGLYSFSRALIWNHFLDKKVTLHWRWNLLYLALLIPAIVLILLLVLINTFFGLIISFVGENFFFDFLTTVSSLTFIFAFLIILLAIEYTFAKKYKIGESIIESFHLLKWSNLWPMYLFFILTAAVLSLIVFGLTFVFSFSNMTWLNVLVTLFFFSWLRLYFFNSVHESH